ncbi:hypothetical protein CsSME_00003562 [Camellia sinensis var. sinensis]
MDHTNLGPLMECSVLRPKASYFVTEPIEAVSSISQPKVSTPYSSLSVEELSPSPSPERPRQLSEEDLRDPVSLKKLKGADSEIDTAVADPKALCVFTRKPKPRAISRRGSRLKKFPLVDIPIQTVPTAVIPSPGGAVPVGAVSLADNDCCTKVLGLVVVADPKQPQDSC